MSSSAAIPPVLSRDPIQGLREKIEAALRGSLDECVALRASLLKLAPHLSADLGYPTKKLTRDERATVRALAASGANISDLDQILLCLDRATIGVKRAQRGGKLKPISIDGDIARIPLTRGMEAIIDANDVPLVSGFNWSPLKGPKTHYAVTNIPRASLDGVQGKRLLHKIILPVKLGLFVDHIDGDGLNCRRSNLRPATKSQNCFNRAPLPSNKTGVSGVSFRKIDGKWAANITVDCRRIQLGGFDTIEEAIEARRAAERKYRSEFVRARS